MAAVDGSSRTPRRRPAAAAGVRTDATDHAGERTAKRMAGGPKRIVLTAGEMRRVHRERDAMALLLTALGWNGTLTDWIEMLVRMEGVGGDIEHFRTETPQLILLELDGAVGDRPQAEVRLLDAVRTVNRRWRDRTGRSLIGVLPV